MHKFLSFIEIFESKKPVLSKVEFNKLMENCAQTVLDILKIEYKGLTTKIVYVKVYVVVLKSHTTQDSELGRFIDKKDAENFKTQIGHLYSTLGSFDPNRHTFSSRSLNKYSADIEISTRFLEYQLHSTDFYECILNMIDEDFMHKNRGLFGMRRFGI